MTVAELRKIDKPYRLTLIDTTRGPGHDVSVSLTTDQLNSFVDNIIVVAYSCRSRSKTIRVGRARIRLERVTE